MTVRAAAFMALFLALAADAQTDVPESERAVLLELFNATGGASWTRTRGWNTAASPCEWEGVWCAPGHDERGEAVTHVVGLSLPLNNLRGELPPSLTTLGHLQMIDVMLNQLTGELPEAFLERWDRHEFELSGRGNAFSNMVVSVRIEVSASSVRCARDTDVRYFVELAEDGRAHFESIRCGSGDSEYRLIKDGSGPSLERLSRAFKRLGFDRLRSRYSYPFTFATHQAYVRTSVRFGDGRTQEVETYGAQGPLEAWLAERAVLGLVQEVQWEKQRRAPIP
jgi:hypothetical protein